MVGAQGNFRFAPPAAQAFIIALRLECFPLFERERSAVLLNVVGAARVRGRGATCAAYFVVNVPIKFTFRFRLLAFHANVKGMTSAVTKEAQAFLKRFTLCLFRAMLSVHLAASLGNQMRERGYVPT